MQSTNTPQVTPIKARTSTKASKTPVLASQELADLQRLTIKEVQALTGRCEESIRTMIKAGKFPAADYRDGPRCVRWSAGLVRKWLESTRIQAQH